jgi:hypothetical protein
MANLRANRITSTEVFETTGSVQFDGSGDYLSLASSTDFSFGTGDFTVECWVYLTANISDNISIAGPMIVVGATNGLWIGNYQGNFVLRAYGISNLLTTSYPPLNQWVHIAVTRNNSIARIFFNGVLQNSGTVTQNFAQSNLYVGSDGPGVSPGYTTGHISNLRVLKGTALYTTNFTPPTRELEVIPNTVLLACQSTTNTTEEKTGKTITVNGNAVANELTPGLLTNVVKSGGSSAITGSVEFDGTGDYLLDSTGADGFNGGVGDWTIEFWIYCTEESRNENILNGITSSTDRFYISFGNRTFYLGDGTTNNIVVNNIKQLNAWMHIAVTKSSTQYRAFLNGILFGSSTTPLVNSTLTSMEIGTRTSGGFYTKSFISNLRIIKGTALYTSNFIPPTRKLTKLPGTVLLCCQDSNNPLTEATGKTITGYGDLQKADGVELVTNGTFDTDVSGWTEFESTNTWSSGKMQITRNGGFGRSTYQTFTTVPGYAYTITSEVNSVGSRGDIYIMYGTGWTNIDNPLLYLRGTSGQTRILSGHFTATTTTTTLAFAVDVNGTSIIVDNVSVSLRNPGPKPPFVPQIGSDGSVEFAGPTTINTENYFYLPTGPTEQRSRGRGVFGGGQTPTAINNIDYVTIASTGNSIDFGDLYQISYIGTSCSSSTRGLFAGGLASETPPAPDTNVIQYITISSTGNSQDFGDISYAAYGQGGCSSSVRGLFAGGTPNGGPTNVNNIEYVIISSTGNTLDFGDLTVGRRGSGSCSSPTRGLFAGGRNPGDLNTIDYVTIASTGNAQDFGDLTVIRSFRPSGCSNSTRGIFGGGISPTLVNTIDYVTIQSIGNAIDFGDLTIAIENNSSCSSSIRGVFGGGQTPTAINNIDYVTIMSTGNASDFGDLTVARDSLTACSDSHGGLG